MKMKTYNFYYSEQQWQRILKTSECFPEFTLNKDGKAHKCFFKGIQYTEMREVGKGEPNFSDAELIGVGGYEDITLNC